MPCTSVTSPALSSSGEAQNDLVVGVSHHDKLDRSGIHANVGTAAFSGTASESRVDARANESGSYTVSADTNGDHAADLAFHLQNAMLDLGSADVML